MKVLLLNPSLREENISHYKSSIEKARGRYPSLGLLSIASVFESLGHQVKVFDVDIEKKHSSFLNFFEEYSPDILGVHLMTWTFHQANNYLKQAKEKNPSVITIAGGAAVTSMPDEVMNNSSFDYGVIGEGEATIVDLVKAIETKATVENIDGLIWRNKNKITINKPRKYIANLDELNFPARHLVNINKYFDVFTRARRFATTVTSRGCPYSCLYCDRANRMGRQWRSYSNEKIISELVELKSAYGVGEVMFFDDEFIVDRDKTMDLCLRIKKENLNILWECRARVDTVDFELLSAMKQAGCYRIRFGFESGDDGILKILKKQITVRQSLSCADAVKRAGIEIFAYFMMGSPGETVDSLKKTKDLLFAIDPEFAVLSKVILIPGSELFDLAVSERFIPFDYWKSFFQGETVDTAPAISTKDLPAEYVSSFIDRTNRDFFLRPGFLLKRLFSIRSWSQFYRQAVMGYSLLKG
ncbi:MAG: radical SAM protein [Candidatus Omnitrophica bacterium]|nr:radical SAM protein [Candidatus Omnitrophota bacterium]